MNRKELDAEKNRIRLGYQDFKEKMRASNASPEQMQVMKEKVNAKLKQLDIDHGDGLMQEATKIRGGTVSRGLSQEGMPDMSKVVGLGKEQMWDNARLKRTLDSISDATGDIVDSGKKVARKVGKGLKMVPVLGTAIGVGSAIANQDASAAIAPLDQEALGPEAGSDEEIIESPKSSMEERKRAHRRLQGFPDIKGEK